MKRQRATAISMAEAAGATAAARNMRSNEWWRGGVNKEYQLEKQQRQQHVVGPQPCNSIKSPILNGPS